MLRRYPSPEARSTLGLFGALTYHYRAGMAQEKLLTRVFRLRAKDALYPLYCRPGTSDLEVFRQVFMERQYACLGAAPSPRLIVDCGANVGYSSAYFLSRFPDAKLIAVEPDSGNFQMLQRNLAPLLTSLV